MDEASKALVIVGNIEHVVSNTEFLPKDFGAAMAMLGFIAELKAEILKTQKESLPPETAAAPQV